MSITKIIGKNIKSVRQIKGISQEELGFKLNVTQSYISAIETGKRNISAKSMEKIGKTLGIKPHLLVDPNLENKLKKSIK